MRHEIFLSPHNDDAVLFGAFRLLAHDSTVITVFDAVKQNLIELRRNEDVSAISNQLGREVYFCGLTDKIPLQDLQVAGAVTAAIAVVLDFHREYELDTIWVPASYGVIGNVHHEQLSRIGSMLPLGDTKLRYYHTYTRYGKVERGEESVPTKSAHIRKKLLALACYESQIEHAEFSCWPHFLRDQREWVVPEGERE